MTHSVVGGSAIALGLAAVVSLSTLTARSETSPAAPSATSGEAASPVGAAATTGNPATPGSEAVRPPARPYVHVTRPYVRHYAHHYTRHAHYAWRKGRRYAYHDPVAAGAAAVVGGVADLGSIAAYPVYCFPHYGSCPVYLPY